MGRKKQPGPRQISQREMMLYAAGLIVLLSIVLGVVIVMLAR